MALHSHLAGNTSYTQMDRRQVQCSHFVPLPKELASPEGLLSLPLAVSFWPALPWDQTGNYGALAVSHTRTYGAWLGTTLLRIVPSPTHAENWRWAPHSQSGAREGGRSSGCSWLMGSGPSSIPPKFLRALYPAG